MTYRQAYELLGRYAFAAVETGLPHPQDIAEQRPDLLSAEDAKNVYRAIEHEERQQEKETA